MADIVDLQAEGDIVPANNFGENTPAHYSQTTYTFPRAHDSYAIDADLQMVEAMSQSMQDNMGGQRQRGSNGNPAHAQNQHITIPQAASNAPAMAPPQAPNQPPFPSPTIIQTGLEDVQELGNMSGDRKRKRSKVSRACDECRRKKIRCDATDDDGSVKTCSNCSKVQQLCSFSRIPMKRGPSKGYIKELSERVQQVESQIAISGQSAGYRQSVDSGSVSGIYPDSSYSPEEPMSLKRGFSFSENKSPFAQPHFTDRDTMPSSGGWGSAAGVRTRESKESIALAPDQQSLEVSTTQNGHPIEYIKPFWAQQEDEDTLAYSPVFKTARPPGEEGFGLHVDLTQESLNGYIQTVHKFLPILPDDIQIIITHLRSCTQTVQEIFFYVLKLIHGNTNPKIGQIDSFDSMQRLVSVSSIFLPLPSHDSVNLVWTWIYVLLAIYKEKNLRQHNVYTGLASSELVKMASKVVSRLMEDIAVQNRTSKYDEFTLISFRRAFNATAILARPYALGTAKEDPFSLRGFGEIGVSRTGAAALPEVLLVFARLSNILGIVISHFQTALKEHRPALQSIRNRLITEQHIQFVLSTTPDDTPAAMVVKQFRHFVGILLTRSTFINNPTEVLMPAIELAELLHESTIPSLQEQPSFNPFDIHFFTLTTITLLEFTQTVDERLTEKASNSLSKIKQALEMLNKSGEDTAEKDMITWTDSLLKMINMQSKSDEINGATREEGAGTGRLLVSDRVDSSEAFIVSGHAGFGDKITNFKTGVTELVNFRELLRYGYINVLRDRYT